ncbi:Intraflagellar transport protein 46 [Blattella germanica]|nr:Intraflagellar transport protein 46 [Blattella germanica]
MSTNKDSDDEETQRIKLSETLYDESIDVEDAEEVKSPTPNSNNDRDQDINTEYEDKAQLYQLYPFMSSVTGQTYDPNEFNHLNVSTEVKDLFQNITRYVVKKVESAEKNTKSIERWIKDISDLHRSKPPPTVHYSKQMPDIDSLMQEWPAEVEQQLRETGLPIADLDCELSRYVDIVCSLFDIPVYESRIQSLHVLFMLYSAVKNSQYLNAREDETNESGDK